MKKLNHLKGSLYLASALMFISLVVVYAIYCKLYPAATWYGITPGQTTETEVVTQMGDPSAIEERKGKIVYLYYDRQDFGWERIEIWFYSTEQKSIVGGVTLLYPLKENKITGYKITELIKDYNKPNFVSWSLTPYQRFIAWTNRGVALELEISSYLHQGKKDPTFLKTKKVFLFEPKSVFAFCRFNWPWSGSSGWSSENLYRPGVSDTVDLQPRDPINWNLMVP